MQRQVSLRGYKDSDASYMQKNMLYKIKDMLPFDRTQEGKRERMKMWNLMDSNSNKFLSLAEIDRGFKSLRYFEIYKAKKSMIRAFNKTKSSI